MSDPLILDVIIATFSQNFQRAVLYKVGNNWAWREPDLVRNAIEETVLNIKSLITGADDIIDNFEKMIQSDTDYKAPEQGGCLIGRFRWLRDEIMSRDPKIVAPIAVGAAKEKDLVQALLKRSSLEYGWHDNPDNHTFDVTLYFGSRDPRHLFQQDQYGKAKLTLEILEFLAE